MGTSAAGSGYGDTADRAVPHRPARPLLLDLAFYAACAIYALSQFLVSEFYGFRIWGGFAAIGYGLAAAHTGWLLARHPAGRFGSRWIGVAAVGVIGMLAPLIVLVTRRLTGVDWLVTPWSWAAQPEVWVIERSASLLLDTGTPYVDVTALGRAPVVNDYTPYGPVMTIFGIPRALFGGTPVTDALTDARLYFALAAAGCAYGTWRVLGKPAIPVRAAQLVLAFPLTALTFAVAGPDLAIVAVLVLACAYAARDHPLIAAALLAAVGNAKLIALLAAPVLGVLILRRLGHRALGGFIAALLGVTALLNVPVLLVDPAAYVEHVFKFPTGLGVVESPAASPLPGQLLTRLGTVGQVAAFTVLAAAAAAIAVWLLRLPPRLGSDAVLRIAVGLGAFTLLTPATRFGYLLYPVVLLGAMLCFRRAEEKTVAATSF